MAVSVFLCFLASFDGWNVVYTQLQSNNLRSSIMKIKPAFLLPVTSIPFVLKLVGFKLSLPLGRKSARRALVFFLTCCSLAAKDAAPRQPRNAEN